MNRIGAMLSLVAAVGVFHAPPSAAAAPAIRFGAPLEDVAKVYKTTAFEASDGRALIVPSAQIAGVRFDRVALLFDHGHRLEKIRMVTSTETYDHVREAMAGQLMSAPGTDPAFVDAVDQSDDMQIRICEGEGGQITVTFERVTLSS